MELKRVSFDVAKVIKVAGFDQGQSGYCYDDKGILHPTSCTDTNLDHRHKYIDAPTYLEVWLWLWREKKIPISIMCDEDKLLDNHWYPNSKAAVGYIGSFTDAVFHKDPEETIIAAIEYLVDNSLIKHQ